MSLNMGGSFGVSVLRTRIELGVYSLIVPVVLAPALGSGLPLVGCAKVIVESAIAAAQMVAKIVRAGLAMFFFIVTSAAFRMPGGLQTWKCLELTFGTRQRASLQ